MEASNFHLAGFNLAVGIVSRLGSIAASEKNEQERIDLVEANLRFIKELTPPEKMSDISQQVTDLANKLEDKEVAKTVRECAQRVFTPDKGQPAKSHEEEEKVRVDEGSSESLKESPKKSPQVQSNESRYAQLREQGEKEVPKDIVDSGCFYEPALAFADNQILPHIEKALEKLEKQILAFNEKGKEFNKCKSSNEKFKILEQLGLLNQDLQATEKVLSDLRVRKSQVDSRYCENAMQDKNLDESIRGKCYLIRKDASRPDKRDKNGNLISQYFILQKAGDLGQPMLLRWERQESGHMGWTGLSPQDCLKLPTFKDLQPFPPPKTAAQVSAYLSPLEAAAAAIIRKHERTVRDKEETRGAPKLQSQSKEEILFSQYKEQGEEGLPPDIVKLVGCYHAPVIAFADAQFQQEFQVARERLEREIQIKVEEFNKCKGGRQKRNEILAELKPLQDDLRRINELRSNPEMVKSQLARRYYENVMNHGGGGYLISKPTTYHDEKDAQGNFVKQYFSLHKVGDPDNPILFIWERQAGKMGWADGISPQMWIESVRFKGLNPCSPPKSAAEAIQYYDPSKVGS